MKPLSLLPIAGAVLLLTSCSPGEPTPEAPETEAKADFSTFSKELQTVEAGTIDKLHTLNGIFVGSQPQPADFELMKSQGVRTVINLRHADEETSFDEKEIAANLGLDYVNIPWNGADELTDKVLDQSREVLKTAEKPIILHCKSANRTGAIWIVHRVLDDGIGLDEAVAEAKEAGLKSAEYEAKAKDYVKRKSS